MMWGFTLSYIWLWIIGIVVVAAAALTCLVTYVIDRIQRPKPASPEHSVEETESASAPAKGILREDLQEAH